MPTNRWSRYGSGKVFWKALSASAYSDTLAYCDVDADDDGDGGGGAVTMHDLVGTAPGARIDVRRTHVRMSNAVEIAGTSLSTSTRQVCTGT